MHNKYGNGRKLFEVIIQIPFKFSSPLLEFEWDFFLDVKNLLDANHLVQESQRLGYCDHILTGIHVMSAACVWVSLPGNRELIFMQCLQVGQLSPSEAPRRIAHNLKPLADIMVRDSLQQVGRLRIARTSAKCSRPPLCCLITLKASASLFSVTGRLDFDIRIGAL